MKILDQITNHKDRFVVVIAERHSKKSSESIII